MGEQMHLDAVTKVFLVVFVVALSYLILNAVISPTIAREPRTMHSMMDFAYQSPVSSILSLVIALGAGLAVSFALREKKRLARNSRQEALRIVRKKLSDDERKMMKEIEAAGSITQDSLRARLGWSKAKASVTLTRLDRMNLVQRERQGKTYRVFLQKDLR